MFTQDQLSRVLFLDIETAPLTSTYELLPDRLKPLWDRKAERNYQPKDPRPSAELFFEYAGIHAEFGRVVCISCGYLRFPRGDEEADSPDWSVKSFAGTNEREILEEFAKVLNGFAQRGYSLCAHNGKEFDFPYLGRRYVINDLPVPEVLQVQGKKPWETSFIDTMELWKFGDFKAYTSLALISAVLDIPSPKDDIDGSDVARVFWHQQDVERIRIYCEKDVLTTAQVVLKMSRLPLVEDF